MKIIYSSYFKTILVIIIILLGIFPVKHVSAQSWYSTNWLFRRPISIINSGTTVLSDYQVKVTLNNSFNFMNTNANGNDIRITLEDGITEIPFWIEEWNSGIQATIWIRVPNIPTSGSTIYMYYGNAIANSASNGISTFRFFDDFESWNATPGSTGWEDKASVPSSLTDQTSAVYNGKIYSIGGYANSPGNPENKNYEYDPDMDTWTEKAPMPTARSGMLGIEFNGKIYVFGGVTGVGTATGVNKNEVYDPATNTWDTTKSIIPTGLADEGIMGVRVGNKIHLFHLSSHYEYDPALDTYTLKSSMPTSRYWCTCALVGS